MHIELHQITTKDGVPLEGLIFRPQRAGRTAAVWVGGLTSRFSNHPARLYALANTLTRKGIVFASFDHRGFGSVNKLKVQRGNKKKTLLAGTSFEKFEHSLWDLEAVIRFLHRRGYRKVFLLGHSTGANKAAYYLWKRRGRGLAGVGLLGPVSDIPGVKKELGRKYRRALATAKSMIARGKGDALLPLPLVNGALWSAARFWSIAREGANEDTFPYYDPKRKFRWAQRVRVPILVLLGANDQYADRLVRDIVDAFRKHVPPAWFASTILRAADHSFTGRERELARAITRWIERVKQR